jgi:hypothetical protein
MSDSEFWTEQKKPLSCPKSSSKSSYKQYEVSLMVTTSQPRQWFVNPIFHNLTCSLSYSTIVGSSTKFFSLFTNPKVGLGAAPGIYPTSETALEINSTNYLDSRKLADFIQVWYGTTDQTNHSTSWGRAQRNITNGKPITGPI